jgi:imidazolonepropionase-like amidohydrolase
MGTGYYPETYESFACALTQLRATLCAGVTSVREVGNKFSQALSHVIKSGIAPGPHFYYAGKAIGMSGGHSDLQ